jgi:hypothetical protein
MMHFYDIAVEKPSPNSGDTTASWLNGSGFLSIEQWTTNIHGVIGAAYANLSTSGTSLPHSTISTAAGTAYHAALKKTPSQEEAAFEEHRAKLIAAVASMKESAPNWYGDTAKVSEGSALTAEKFLRCLPLGSALPKVAADGEGDVMFVWEGATVSCVVTVEPKTLHLVSKPGSKGVQQIDSQKFLGVQIPPTILRHIPSK